jgi:hypothetical protein
MKKNDVDYLLGYGIRTYKESVQSSSDGSGSEGKWYKKLLVGFVCGDSFTVIRFYSIDNYKILEDIA